MRSCIYGVLVLSKSGIRLLKIAGLCGIIGPFISLLFIAVAIFYSPWFNWFNNALSDLGVHEASSIFNSGLIIGGLLTTIFAIGITQIFKKKILASIGTFVLVLSSLSLCAIGVFPESAGRIHFYVSFSFFALLTISLLIIGTAFIMRSSQQRFGMFTIFMSFVAGFAWAIPHDGVAIPEIISSGSGSVWCVVLGIRILRNQIKH